ncbi:FAD-dependent monooxygenase [Marinicella gelatinilytica]|uniref:FAD-dependent monooxygenase n=1 Tax=Marinicella gelatinilytica TaxID=2996017 RepID=UPI002260DD5B|nr:FAD-dependent monooxygenase [Marinicella gelatinilytica]MCX7545972.1 FAD-dependent monooxygenase [Marinicella gelatinilytica]
MYKFDVIISGGGMVGAVCANAMAAADFKVAMIEAAPQVSCQSDDERSLRVSAIADKHLNFFKALGIQAHIDGERMGYYQNMMVWDNHSRGHLDFTGDNGTDLGAIIENKWVVYAAQKKLQNNDHVAVLYNHTIQSFEQSDRQVTVSLDNNERLQGRLLIACEGARSPLREMAGITVRTNSYRQFAIVCYLQIENAPQRTALQAFNHSGPVALLPVKDDVFSLVWTCDEDYYQQWLDAEESHFIAGLQAHIRRDFGAIKVISDRAAFPLRQMYANETIQNRLVLLGDSAHVVHPLAGQGVNLGLSDVVELVRQIKDINLRDTEALKQALKRYYRRRQSEVLATSELMSFLQRFYAIDQPALTWLRGTGMNLVNGFKPLKNWLVTQAGS